MGQSPMVVQYAPMQQYGTVWGTVPYGDIICTDTVAWDRVLNGYNSGIRHIDTTVHDTIL